MKLSSGGEHRPSFSFISHSLTSRQHHEAHGRILQAALSCIERLRRRHDGRADEWLAIRIASASSSCGRCVLGVRQVIIAGDWMTAVTRSTFELDTAAHSTLYILWTWTSLGQAFALSLRLLPLTPSHRLDSQLSVYTVGTEQRVVSCGRSLNRARQAGWTALGTSFGFTEHGPST